jgi:RNA polymerase sigma factor (sigma-70 family)
MPPTELPEPTAARGGFPTTRRSIVEQLGSDDPVVRDRAFDLLVRAYWKPVYKYIRLKWRAAADEAEDLTQDFFLQALEKGYLDRFDPGRARFRTYLRLCVDGRVANVRKASARQKRGGDARFVELDFAGVERQLADRAPLADEELEEFFRIEWIRSLFELAIERVRSECRTAGKEVHFRLFERYDMARAASAPVPTYAELAAETGLPETQITNYLAFVRRRLRHHVLEVLTELTVNDAELAAETRDVLGADRR